MAIIEGDKRTISVVELTKQGKYNVEVSAPKPRNTAIVPETKLGVVELSQRGITGPQGERGPSIVVGNGPPAPDDGVANDLYFDKDLDEFWGPKEDTGWPAEPFFRPTQNARHIHTQPTSASVWTITHTLGGYPSVTITDSASTIVLGEISYISTSQVQVSFSAPFSGFAYLT